MKKQLTKARTSRPLKRRDCRPITLNEHEIRHIVSCPDGLEVAMDYHDLQMTMGEPMGFDCSGNQKRYDELKAERDRIREEWEGVKPNTQAEPRPGE